MYKFLEWQTKQLMKVDFSRYMKMINIKETLIGLSRLRLVEGTKFKICIMIRMKKSMRLMNWIKNLIILVHEECNKK